MGVGEDTQGKIHPGDDFRFKGYPLEVIPSGPSRSWCFILLLHNCGSP
jgi:hypothetical protein